MSARLIRYTVLKGNYGKHARGSTFDLLEGSEAELLARAAATAGRLRWKVVAGHVPRAPRGHGEVPHGGIRPNVAALFATLEGALRTAVDAAGKLPREEREQLAQLLRDNRRTLEGHLANLPLMEAEDKALAFPEATAPIAEEEALDEGTEDTSAEDEAAARRALEAARAEGEAQRRGRVLHQPPTPPVAARPAPAPAPDKAPEASSEGTPTEGGKPRASNPLPKPVDEMDKTEATAALKSALATSDDYTTSVLILLGRKAGLPMPGLSGKKKEVVVGALRDLLLGEEEEGTAGEEAAATPPAPPPPPEQPSTPPAAASVEAP